MQAGRAWSGAAAERFYDGDVADAGVVGDGRRLAAQNGRRIGLYHQAVLVDVRSKQLFAGADGGVPTHPRPDVGRLSEGVVRGDPSKLAEDLVAAAAGRYEGARHAGQRVVGKCQYRGAAQVQVVGVERGPTGYRDGVGAQQPADRVDRVHPHIQQRAATEGFRVADVFGRA